MLSKVELFRRTPYGDPAVAAQYLVPTCQRVETRFRSILQQGVRGSGKPNEIHSRDGVVAARFYRARLSRLSDWVECAGPTVEDAPVLVKNPEGSDVELGETNALTLVGGDLFVAIPTGGNGLGVRRPVRGRNLEGTNIDYYTELTQLYRDFLKEIPEGTEIPVWHAF